MSTASRRVGDAMADQDYYSDIESSPEGRPRQAPYQAGSPQADGYCSPEASHRAPAKDVSTADQDVDMVDTYPQSSQRPPPSSQWPQHSPQEWVRDDAPQRPTVPTQPSKRLHAAFASQHASINYSTGGRSTHMSLPFTPEHNQLDPADSSTSTTRAPTSPSRISRHPGRVLSPAPPENPGWDFAHPPYTAVDPQPFAWISKQDIPQGTPHLEFPLDLFSPRYAKRPRQPPTSATRDSHLDPPGGHRSVPMQRTHRRLPSETRVYTPKRGRPSNLARTWQYLPAADPKLVLTGTTVPPRSATPRGSATPRAPVAPPPTLALAGTLPAGHYRHARLVASAATPAMKWYGTRDIEEQLRSPLVRPPEKYAQLSLEDGALPRPVVEPWRLSRYWSSDPRRYHFVSARRRSAEL